MATYQTVTNEDKIDAAPFVSQANETLRAAALLRDAGLAADSATRAHQACIHAERALLATEKRSPQDVHGVHRMATLHFLQNGQIPRAHLAAVERLAVLRQRADDVPLGRVTGEDAIEAVAAAREFVAAVETWLVRNRFLEPTS
ncbi:MAG: HEPN domain-containing protein [Planctomycetes bacterium]|nr:HEPN domain-containing protein [Planctomycetota bacterium]